MRTKEESIELIKAYCDANGVSGFEEEVAALGQKENQAVCDTKVDFLRNLYLNLKTNKGDRPKVWLDAHSDEVGFIVQAIRPNGTLEFLPLGGWDPNNVPASKVRVQNADGEWISGIVASKPVHYMTAGEKGKALDFSDMTIDVGAVSAEDLKENFHIRMAAPVVPDVTCTYDERRDLFLGKAMDCRVGCAVLTETMNRLSKEALDVDVVGTLSVQEEVGERGSMAAVQNIDADIAIIFEGCPADDTFSPEYRIQSGLKRGPMLRHFDKSMITNPRFQRYALDLAEKKEIPVQEAVRAGGGTNAKYIHTSRFGVPTIVIGVPVRFTHSSHCFCTLEDYEHAVRLATELVKSLNVDVISRF